MLKYLTKFAMEIIPSVVATIIGAYIVNHYINTKPDSPPSTRPGAPCCTVPIPPCWQRACWVPRCC